MKKELIIRLVDGRRIVRDIADLQATGAPIGAPANDPAYANLCHAVAINGYTDIEKVNDKVYCHIAPGQIKSVSVEFSNP